MTTITDSVVALPNGSAPAGADSPPVRRTRVRARVDDTPRSRKTRAAAARRRLRSAVEVVYLDAADSWIVRESTPSIRQVWSTDYPALAKVDYAPFRLWCRAWRLPAVLAAAGLDSAKWMLIHPVRGPLFLTATGASIGAAVLF